MLTSKRLWLGRIEGKSTGELCKEWFEPSASLIEFTGVIDWNLTLHYASSLLAGQLQLFIENPLRFRVLLFITVVHNDDCAPSTISSITGSSTYGMVNFQFSDSSSTTQTADDVENRSREFFSLFFSEASNESEKKLMNIFCLFLFAPFHGRFINSWDLFRR